MDPGIYGPYFITTSGFIFPRIYPLHAGYLHSLNLAKTIRVEALMPALLSQI
jgi:hypothetical protein